MAVATQSSVSPEFQCDFPRNKHILWFYRLIARGMGESMPTHTVESVLQVVQLISAILTESGDYSFDDGELWYRSEDGEFWFECDDPRARIDQDGVLHIDADCLYLEHDGMRYEAPEIGDTVSIEHPAIREALL